MIFDRYGVTSLSLAILLSHPELLDLLSYVLSLMPEVWEGIEDINYRELGEGTDVTFLLFPRLSVAVGPHFGSPEISYAYCGPPMVKPNSDFT